MLTPGAPRPHAAPARSVFFLIGGVGVAEFPDGAGLQVGQGAQGRANLYRLARPELAALLQAAELLLAGVGHDVQLCGNYGDPCQSDTASQVRP